MAITVTANVVVHGPAGPVWLRPGVEIPEWALDTIGAHLLTETEPTEPEADGDSDSEPGSETTDAASAAADSADDAAEATEAETEPEATAPRRSRSKTKA